MSTHLQARPDQTSRPQRNRGPNLTPGMSVTLAGVAAVFLAVLLTGHQPGPWWAWFPLTTGLVLLSAGFRLYLLDALPAAIAGRALVVAGSAAVTTGVLLLFEVMPDGWPAYLVVVGTALMGVAIDQVGRAGAAADVVHRLLMVWGMACVFLGVVFALQFGAGIALLGLFAAQQWCGLAIAVVGAHAGIEGAGLWASGRTMAVVMSTVLLSAGLAAVVQGVALTVGIW